MSRTRLILPIVLALLVLPVVPALAQTLEGNWVMVEQRYGKGEANQADTETPLHLHFAPTADAWMVFVWGGVERDKAVEWPAHVTENGIQTVEVLERRSFADGNGISVKYVLPDRDPGETIQITEKYQLAEDGQALVGTVLVEISKDDKDHGSYTLHRRFERAR